MVFWDVLYRRYSNPLPLLQQMLDSNQCPEFIDNVIRWQNEENEEKWLWELWLHKVFDESFDDFMKKHKPQEVSPDIQDIEESKLEATIRNSLDVLEAFSISLENKGGINGTI